MSIQGNINQILGDLSRHITTSAIAENTARQAEYQNMMATGGLTDEELKIMEKAHGLPDDDMAMELVENRIGDVDELNQIKSRLNADEYKKYTNAVYKQIQKEQRDMNIKGLSRTPDEMQRAQYSAYRNLANLKLGDINNRASYAQGIDPYERETVNGVPKFQHSTDDLSNDDWGSID